LLRVAVVRNVYLPISETFIYSELVHLKKVKPILCTQRVENLSQFPFSKIYKYKSTRDLKKIIRKKRVDLIHARFGTAGVEVMGLKKNLRVPLLTSFHGSDLPTNRGRKNKYRIKLRSLFRIGDAFTVTSRNMKKILVRYGCPRRKIHIHRSGIDMKKFAFTPRSVSKNEKIILLSVGRLVEKKGMKYLIDAFKKVHKKYPQIELRIAGDGPLREQLEDRAKSYHLDDKIIFLGKLTHEEVVKEMQQAHLFILASRTAKDGNQEGIPNVLKEAMASGIPVISTRHAGIPELIQHGKSGYLVPEKDKKALAKHIRKLIRRSHRWEKMGKAGRKRVVKFYNQKKQVRKLENLYKRIYKQARRKKVVRRRM
jgi:colanic acid/amylovoran biosynthesis glycosyltransferase